MHCLKCWVRFFLAKNVYDKIILWTTYAEDGRGRGNYTLVLRQPNPMPDLLLAMVLCYSGTQFHCHTMTTEGSHNILTVAILEVLSQQVETHLGCRQTLSDPPDQLRQLQGWGKGEEVWDGGCRRWRILASTFASFQLPFSPLTCTS